jgi:hypothetical protein
VSALVYRVRVMAAVAILLFAAWGLVSYAIEHGPPWLAQLFIWLAVFWLATLAGASLFFAMSARRHSGTGAN